jgi:GNAT superfamily N-acetyltransferase
MMIVRPLKLGEAVRMRAIRLGALSDAPYAFGSALECEVKYPIEHWENLAEQSDAGERSVVFIAVDGTRWLGMAGGILREEDPPVASVWGMWIDGSARRQGFGRALLQTVREWASGRGAVRLELSVTDRAPAAAALYRELGFQETGETHPLASDPSITELLMTQPLRPR